ncbi:transmembrane protease serine 9 [Eleginops maclovinus]|uniref:transmembrane protease serine 9 n=1 Tax=Eleginops maclovinus TaxID=56733 RepID=UPI00308059B5
MFYRCDLLILILALTLGGQVRTGKIIGGHEAAAHSRPYMVLLERYMKDGSTKYCSGFLLNEDFVMTAAHCLARSYQVLLGAHNIQHKDEILRINVDQTFPHKDYNATNFRNDIMLLKLSSKAKLSKHVGPISLASQSDGSLPKSCSVSGWGRKDKNINYMSFVLMEVNVTLSDNELCAKDNLYCSEGEIGPVEGDSGGPLVCEDEKAYGVVSYIFKPSSGAQQIDCYAKISDYSRWIYLTVTNACVPLLTEAQLISDLTMFLRYELLALILALALFGQVHAGEIIGGQVAKAQSRPYMVLLKQHKHDGEQGHCGGILLNADFVMTAAHCQASSYEVFLGLSNMSNKSEVQNTTVEKSYPHDEYNANDNTNDIMILKMSSRAIFSKSVRPIALACQGDDFLPKSCSISGWGETAENEKYISRVLMEANVTLINDEWCNKNHLYCSKGKPRPAGGDSGGPLVCEDEKAYGLVSMGFQYDHAKSPYVYAYTKISDYTNWIESIVGC